VSFLRSLLFSSAIFLTLSEREAFPSEAFLAALGDAPEISNIRDEKKFLILDREKTRNWKQSQVFLVVRKETDSLRRQPKLSVIGRSAVVDVVSRGAVMVLYKPFEGQKAKEGDYLIRTGDPLTAEEMGLIQDEILGVLEQDDEIEAYYKGVMSLKMGFYGGMLDSTSASDTNAFKKSPDLFMSSFGLRWWQTFYPRLGVNIEYAKTEIPTITTFSEEAISTHMVFEPGLIYRSRLFGIPIMYSLTYFTNRFETTNPDDFLISSAYSGVNVGGTIFYPLHWSILSLGRSSFNLEYFELGGKYAPSVDVSEKEYSRGTSVEGSARSFHFGVEFNLTHSSLQFTRNLFIIIEGGMQRMDLEFSGSTQGELPTGEAIPRDGKHTEWFQWWGVRLKYNLPDYLGEFLYDL
jgi:hypothetical protein